MCSKIQIQIKLVQMCESVEKLLLQISNCHLWSSGPFDYLPIYRFNFKPIWWSETVWKSLQESKLQCIHNGFNGVPILVLKSSVYSVYYTFNNWVVAYQYEIFVSYMQYFWQYDFGLRRRPRVSKYICSEAIYSK